MIHDTDPFATPEQDRSPVRRLRGRLAAPVTLWTGYAERRPAGLTVSSVLVVDGEPGRVLGLVDEESELWTAISGSGRFTVCPLGAGQQRLADRFAGLEPAPGGLFAQGERWRETGYGPVLAGELTWAGCELDGSRRFGWGLLVEGTVREVTLGTDDTPLIRHRGRYRTLH
jgi:3-hydroxy-9,10-secoandrosta-1,3,5(10)-triene-9,17-dione monooxygenase reductase component